MIDVAYKDVASGQISVNDLFAGKKFHSLKFQNLKLKISYPTLFKIFPKTHRRNLVAIQNHLLGSQMLLVFTQKFEKRAERTQNCLKFEIKPSYSNKLTTIFRPPLATQTPTNGSKCSCSTEAIKPASFIISCKKCACFEAENISSCLLFYSKAFFEKRLWGLFFAQKRVFPFSSKCPLKALLTKKHCFVRERGFLFLGSEAAQLFANILVHLKN